MRNGCWRVTFAHSNCRLPFNSRCSPSKLHQAPPNSRCHPSTAGLALTLCGATPSHVPLARPRACVQSVTLPCLPAAVRRLRLRVGGECREVSRAAAAVVTGGWRAVAVAVPAVVKRLGGDGGQAEAVGGTDSRPRRPGGGGGLTTPLSNAGLPTPHVPQGPQTK